MSVLIIASLAMLVVMSVVSAQSPPFGVYPGDPVSAADEVFVSLDTSQDATCGVTAANNIRCWGNNIYAPVWAGGFTDVAVGRRHSCGLKLDGTVQCWGVDSFGSNMLTPPTDNGSPIRFKSIDSNTSYTCGIRADNDGLVCWGSDAEGQVSGTRGDSTGLYTPPRPLHRAYDYSNDAFAKISTSSLHTCGILIPDPGDTSTNVRCWGANSGARGIAVVPEIHLSTIFKDIDAGSNFNCGLIDGGDDDGKAVCWGTNSYGIIGTAIGTGSLEQFIGELSVDRFTKISPGWYHVCGIKTDGMMSCWGATKASGVSVAYGQADVPAEHQSSTFSEVVATRYHTCAILDGQNGQVEGDVVCWGAEIPYDPLRPNIVPDGRVFDPDHPYPPPHRFPQIASGINFNCGLSASRDLVCWGGSTYSPGIVEGPFKTLDMGEAHVCAVRESGHVNCWGFNNNLQGSAWTPNFDAIEAGTLNPTPLYIDTQAVKDLTTRYTFKSVSASYFHTCGILDGRTVGQTDGAVLCWGHKTNGQATPPEDMTFSFISAGWYHACGLLDGQNGQIAGTPVCWGAENNLDENGNVVRTVFNADSRADFGQADVPADLGDVPLSTISARRYHTCGIRADNGRLVCWGFSELAEVPEEFAEEQFSAVATSWQATCGIDSESLVKCWGPDRWSTTVQQFRVPTDYAEIRFVAISMGPNHACATKEDGTVICWGADADVSTPQLEIYRPHATVPGAFTIINARQAWVPREFRASPINPPPTPTPLPLVYPDILRIEPAIRGVSLRPGEAARLSVEVYGRQDIRDDTLGDSPGISFEWTAEDLLSQSVSGNGELAEWVRVDDARGRNGRPDDPRVLYTAPSDPGRYRVRVALQVGPECLGAREGETEQDAVERCTAMFDVRVLRRSIEPSPSPEPVDPEGEIPDIIVDEDGRNYEVFTPEGGGEFIAGECTFKAPRGAVNDHEVIGVSITVLEDEAERVQVEDHRFMTDGVQCRIDGVDSDGTPLIDYRLGVPGEVCMPLPKSFTGKAVDTLVGFINEDSTLTRLSSKLYLASPEGHLKVCGNLSTLSATTVVALPGEVAEELPPTPAPPEVAEIETGGSGLSEVNAVALMLLGIFAISALAVMMLLVRRGRV